MTYTTAHKQTRMEATRNRLDGGALVVQDAGVNTLFSATLESPSGTVAGAVLTLSGFPKAVSASAGGVAASAKLVNASGGDEKTGLTVGLPGSGATVIIDNGSGTLAISANATVTVGPAPTITHAA